MAASRTGRSYCRLVCSEKRSRMGIAGYLRQQFSGGCSRRGDLQLLLRPQPHFLLMNHHREIITKNTRNFSSSSKNLQSGIVDDASMTSESSLMTGGTTTRSQTNFVTPVIREAERVLAFQKRFTKDTPKEEQIQEFISEMLDAVDDLLAQTELLPLETLKVHGEVRATLHPAFLAATQWCLLISTTSPRNQRLVLDNPFLELAFRLSAAASELDIPFHLPLYRQLIEAAAQQSLNPVTNITNTLRQTRDALGPIQSSFCGPSLVTLAKRGRLMDVCNIVSDLHKHDVENLDPVTTRELLKILNPYIKNVLHLDRYESPIERDAVCLTLLLESSIWNSLGEGAEMNGTLQEGIDTILESSWSGDEDSDFEDFENDFISSFDDEDLDDSDEFHDFQSFSPSNSSEERLTELIQLMADADGKIPDNLQLKVMQAGDETILTFTDKEDDLSDDEEYDELQIAASLYRRRGDFTDLPDLSHQFFMANNEEPVLYSKDFEKHLMDQLFDEIDNDER